MKRFIPFVVLFFASSVLSAQTSGKALFDAHCARCHGIGGTGGEGPSLNRGELRHVGDDASLADVIRNGIPDTEMPGTWMLGERDVDALVAYVGALGRAVPETAEGDARRGKELYETRGGCVVCHVVDGEGGTVGPELTNIGAVRGIAYLRESLVAPGASVAESYVVVRAVDAARREIVGARVNEDSFTIQVRDESGRFHSLDKRELKALEKRFGESLMPSADGMLSSDEVDDIVTYLSKLTGAS